jgi:hypothetical protein
MRLNNTIENKVKRNYEAQSLTNLMLKDKIKRKKPILKNDLKID